MPEPLKPICMFSTEGDEHGPFGLTALDIYEREAVFPLKLQKGSNRATYVHLIVYDSVGELIGSTIVMKTRPESDVKAATQYYMDMCHVWVKEKGSE